MPLLLLFACTGQRFRHVELTFERPEEAVDIASVSPLQVLQPGDAQDAVRSGFAVGHVLFRGGYVTESTATGQQNVSREATVDGGAGYTADVAAWTATIARPFATAEAPAPTPPPTRRDLRGSYALLGRDNQPLPRFALDPAPLQPAPGLDGAILVPWLAGAWTHNGGWFYGQTWGSAAGARIRLWWGVYDGQTGAPLGWTDCAAVVRHDAWMSPNAAQVEDLWLTAGALLQRRCRPRL